MRLKRLVLACALFVFIAGMAIVVSGCSGTSQPTVEATLTGVVVHDGTGEPLEGVRVVADNQQTETGADGAWTLQVDNQDGTTVNILAEGYLPGEVEVAEASGAIDVGTTRLEPQLVEDYGAVTGIIADAGRRVEGAEVSAGPITAITDADGSYTLYNVPEGRQEVLATKGQKSGIANVIVISRRTVTADIAISSGPPSPL